MLWEVTDFQTMNAGALKDVVVLACFSVSDVQDGVSGRIDEAVTLPSPEGGEFIPYKEITPPVALKWVKDALGEDRVAMMEGEVQAQIDAQKVPQPKQTPLPWKQAS